jgi:large subunit ribosomal protein L18
MASKNKAEIRRGVHSRIRKKVRGTQERPRLAVFRSLNHIYVQIIDDDSGKTLAAASSAEKDLGVKSGGNIDAAQTIGKTIAERALAAGVSQVVYDRGGYLYHGRVKALLDATRESGLNKNEMASGKSSADDSSTVESITDTVSSAIKSVGNAVSNLISGDSTAEGEKPKRNKKENNENEQTTNLSQ